MEQTMQTTANTRNLILLSAGMSLIAGLLHFWLAPLHWEHAPAHGIFFAIAGVAQVMWGALVWRRPTTRLLYAGALLSGWLIVLYALTRWLPAPFGHGPEAVDLVGVACKVCELAALIPPVMLIAQGAALNSGRGAVWRTAGLIMALAFAAALSTYTLARAAEPYFPGLTTPAVEHQSEQPAAEDEHQHDDHQHEH
jgi:hypothetical protein